MRPAQLPLSLALEEVDGALAVLHLTLAATPVGYGIWGSLTARYPTTTVASSAPPVTGERFRSMRPAGMALVVAGLGMGAPRWPFAPRPAGAGVTAPPPRAKTPRPLSGQPAPGKNPP